MEKTTEQLEKAWLSEPLVNRPNGRNAVRKAWRSAATLFYAIHDARDP